MVKKESKSKTKQAQKTTLSGKEKDKEIISKSSKATVGKEKKRAVSQREKDILEIKKKLLLQRDALLSGAEEALNSLPVETNFPDMGDQATAETDRSFMLRLKERERLLLKKIEDAIERIESGTFGICQRCGNEIGIKRLEARPVTALCIECKTAQEEEERIAEGG